MVAAPSTGWGDTCTRRGHQGARTVPCECCRRFNQIYGVGEVAADQAAAGMFKVPVPSPTPMEVISPRGELYGNRTRAATKQSSMKISPLWFPKELNLSPPTPLYSTAPGLQPGEGKGNQCQPGSQSTAQSQCTTPFFVRPAG